MEGKQQRDARLAPQTQSRNETIDSLHIKDQSSFVAESCQTSVRPIELEFEGLQSVPVWNSQYDTTFASYDSLLFPEVGTTSEKQSDTEPVQNDDSKATFSVCPAPCYICNIPSDISGRSPPVVYSSSDDFDVHLWVAHLDSSEWAERRCLLSGCRCKSNFRTVKLWLAHVRNVHQKSYYCYHPDCKYRFGGPTPKAFGSQSSLNRHNLSISHAQPVYCDKPGCTGKQNLARKDIYLRHNMNYHGPFLCQFPDCPRGQKFGVSYGFGTSEALTEHHQQNHERYFDCVERTTQSFMKPGIPDVIANFSWKAAVEAHPKEEDDKCHLSSRTLLFSAPENQTSDHKYDSEPKEPQITSEETKIRNINAIAEENGDNLSESEDGIQSMSSMAIKSPPAATEAAWRHPDTEIDNLEAEELHGMNSASNDVIVKDHFVDALPLTPDLHEERWELRQETLQPEPAHFETLPKASKEKEKEADVVREHDDRDEYSDDSFDEYSSESEASIQEDCALESLDPYSYINDTESLRQLMIDRIMDQFWVVYRKYISPSMTANGGASPSSASEMHTTSQTVKGKQTSKSSLRKRPRQVDNNDDERSSDRDDRAAPPSRKKPRARSDPERALFACPYRKYDPTKYNFIDHRSCAGTAREIFRLKQHLYNHHKAPPHCDRCWQVFTTTKELRQHRNVPKAEVCEMTIGDPPEGVSEEHRETLKSKAPRYPGQEDESKWYDIYKLLLPGKPIPPSPYFEVPREQRATSPHTQELEGYQNYVRSELPRVFLAEIEQQLSPSVFGHVDVEALIQIALQKINRSYPNTTSDVETVSYHLVSNDKRNSVANMEFTSAVPAGTLGDSTSLNELDVLDSMRPPPPQPESHGLDPAFGYTAPENQRRTSAETFSDSGYHSRKPCGCTGACDCDNKTMQALAQTDTGAATAHRATSVQIDSILPTSLQWTTFLHSKAKSKLQAMPASRYCRDPVVAMGNPLFNNTSVISIKNPCLMVSKEASLRETT